MRIWRLLPVAVLVSAFWSAPVASGAEVTPLTALDCFYYMGAKGHGGPFVWTSCRAGASGHPNGVLLCTNMLHTLVPRPDAAEACRRAALP